MLKVVEIDGLGGDLLVGLWRWVGDQLRGGVFDVLWGVDFAVSV
jgi:hypothetical protein